MINLAIITPTYNEVSNVERLLEAIKSVSKKHTDVHITVFVVDDSSPDGTAELIELLAPQLHSKHFAIELILRTEKNGLGRAYADGIKHVLSSKKSYDYILQMDADLSHDPTYISGFIHQAHQQIDLIVATRYTSGGATPDWSWYRKLLSNGGNLYARLFLGSHITDYTGGYNMYKADLLRDIAIDSVQSDGYGFQIELKYRALAHAESVVEIPIVFMDRRHGHSKIPRSTLVKNLILVPKIRLSRKNR